MPLFRGSDPAVVTRILHELPGRPASYAKGDLIALQNSVCRSVFLLCEGSVYARMTNDEGKEFTLDALTAPDAGLDLCLRHREHLSRDDYRQFGL